jgi:hypothetical protein
MVTGTCYVVAHRFKASVQKKDIVIVGGPPCAISARCLIMRSPCPIPHAIKCSSVAGSSAQHRQASAQRDEDIASAKFEATTRPDSALLMLCA